jgi:hypothetical protein
VRSIVLLCIACVLISSCGGDQGAKLTKGSDHACADKVALALNSSKLVTGAWTCFDDYLKGIWKDFGVSSDDSLAHWINSAKYMEAVKFVGNRGLYDTPPFNTAHMLYRMEGHPNGNHIIGYADIEIDPDSGLVHSETTEYCQPQGDLICKGLPT